MMTHWWPYLAGVAVGVFPWALFWGVHASIKRHAGDLEKFVRKTWEKAS